MNTFEDVLFSIAERWQYALGNIARDEQGIISQLRKKFMANANLLYPGYRESEPKARIGVLSLLIPIGCNASCPEICFTDIGQWRKNSQHLTLAQIIGILEEFRCLGGKLVRIIGEGEPILYQKLPELCQWIRQAGMNLIIFSNGLVMPKKIMEEYEKGNLYFYLKLWSEQVEVQNRMVAPRIPY